METKIIEIKAPAKSSIAACEACKALRKGEIISFPTETVYALAGASSLPQVETKLYQLKERPKDKPFAFMVSSKEMISGLVSEISTIGERLIKRCLPGPLTLVFETKGATVGIRMPQDPIALDIIKGSCAPLISTSANLSGEQPAVSGKEVISQFRGKIGLIIDAGESKYKRASTVVLISANRWKILRRGVLSEKALRRCANTVILFVCAGNTCRSPLAEGICKNLLAEIIGVSPDNLEENGYTVTSAGTSASSPAPASENAIRIARDFGVDLTNHLSQPLTGQMVEAADRIFVTEKHQIEYLKEFSRVAYRKSELLGLDGEDIPDPAGGTIDDYRICASRIERALKARVEQL